MLLLLGGLARANPSLRPREALVQGRNAYDRGDYGHAIATLHPLLYPRIELGNEDEVVQAHRLLALSYFFANQTKEAEQEVTSLLAMRPDYQLDPIVDPPVAVRFFEGVRQKQADRLRAVRQRDQEEAERARKEDERRRAEAHARAERIYIEREVEHHSRLIATIPFGVGQAQNGQRKKAIAFAVSELTLGALSLSAYLAIDLKYPVDPRTLHRVFPANEKDTALGLTALQLAAGAAFWATLAWGIIDAHILYKPVVVKEGREVAPPKKRLTVAPILAPSAVGLGLSGVF